MYLGGKQNKYSLLRGAQKPGLRSDFLFQQAALIKEKKFSTEQYYDWVMENMKHIGSQQNGDPAWRNKWTDYDYQYHAIYGDPKHKECGVHMHHQGCVKIEEGDEYIMCHDNKVLLYNNSRSASGDAEWVKESGNTVYLTSRFIKEQMDIIFWNDMSVEKYNELVPKHMVLQRPEKNKEEHKRFTRYDLENLTEVVRVFADGHVEFDDLNADECVSYAGNAVFHLTKNELLYVQDIAKQPRNAWAPV